MLRAQVIWTPGGEHRPECSDSCPDNGRRVQFTSDLKNLLQEVVDMDGWAKGNAVAVLIDGHAEHVRSGPIEHRRHLPSSWDFACDCFTALRSGRHADSALVRVLERREHDHPRLDICAADVRAHALALLLPASPWDVRARSEGGGASILPDW